MEKGDYYKSIGLKSRPKEWGAIELTEEIYLEMLKKIVEYLNSTNSNYILESFKILNKACRGEHYHTEFPGLTFKIKKRKENNRVWLAGPLNVINTLRDRNYPAKTKSIYVYNYKELQSHWQDMVIPLKLSATR